jgi:DNA-binding NtrC family response regulator
MALLIGTQDTQFSPVKQTLMEIGFDVSEFPLGTWDCEYTAEIALLVIEASPRAIEKVRFIRSKGSRTPIVMVSSGPGQECPIEAFRAGVDDYLQHPISADDVVSRVKLLMPMTSQDLDRQRGPISRADAYGTIDLIGWSAQIQKIKHYISKVAPTDTTVLITGETGTGKEMVADLIYHSSKRCGRPFICVNCAAIPESLLESELFGFEKGAFTGAGALQKGKFELAQGGTLFLDEIGDMGQSAQAKILRALEKREIERLGGKSAMRLDVRVIAATNQSLEQLVAEDKFRKDLYYRLNVARIQLPPLRERKDDIPFLLGHFIEIFNRQFGRHIHGMTEEAFRCFMNHDWPGNIRELRNVIEGMFIDISTSMITMRELPETLSRTTVDHAETPSERDRLLVALVATRWNKTKAAQQLHWSRMTLYRKLAKYRIAGPPPGDGLHRNDQPQSLHGGMLATTGSVSE